MWEPNPNSPTLTSEAMTKGTQYHSGSEKEMFTYGKGRQTFTDISDQEVELCSLKKHCICRRHHRNHHMKRAKDILSEEHFFQPSIKYEEIKIRREGYCLTLVARKSIYIQSWTHPRMNLRAQTLPNPSRSFFLSYDLFSHLPHQRI